jgi:hypothetical protein
LEKGVVEVEEEEEEDDDEVEEEPVSAALSLLDEAGVSESVTAPKPSSPVRSLRTVTGATGAVGLLAAFTGFLVEGAALDTPLALPVDLAGLLLWRPGVMVVVRWLMATNMAFLVSSGFATWKKFVIGAGLAC